MQCLIWCMFEQNDCFHEWVTHIKYNEIVAAKVMPYLQAVVYVCNLATAAI